MSTYLLDTNIISYLVRGGYAALDHRFNRLQRECLTSSLCLAEVRLGLALLPKAAKIIGPTESFLRTIEVHPWDSKCAEHFAAMASRQQKADKSLSTMDALIAAHALAHNFVLVSNDAAFRQVKGLNLEDWTKGPQHL